MSQLCELDATHGASGTELVSQSARVSPMDDRGVTTGGSENTGVAPAWVTVTTSPAIVAMPTRACTDMV